MTLVAALFVDLVGGYADLDGVEVWGLPDRDARSYNGPYPVVAHPPCARWSMLRGVVAARRGIPAGQDDGEFVAALRAVRRYGGVLEHPASSVAFSAFDLPIPSRRFGWEQGACGGFSSYVEQARYGHRARKATWLYTYGIAEKDLPPLRWARHRAVGDAVVGSCFPTPDGRLRLRSREAAATPVAFRDELIRIARSAACRPAPLGTV